MTGWTKILTNNLKLVAAAGIGALIVGSGAAATTMNLVSDETETGTVAAATVETETVETVETDETAAQTALPSLVSTSDSPTVGIRPTDTHGYCISTAVHAAKAAGGDAATVKAAKVAGKQACTDAKNAAKAKAKADKAAEKAKAKAAKAAARAAAKAARAEAKASKAKGKKKG